VWWLIPEIPDIWEAEIEGLWLKTTQDKKVCETLSQRTSLLLWHRYVGDTSRRMVVQDWSEQKAQNLTWKK
jgi:hypothetical protein